MTPPPPPLDFFWKFIHFGDDIGPLGKARSSANMSHFAPPQGTDNNSYDTITF